MLLRRKLLTPPRRTRRRGVILLVVLALLTLFAGVGVAFVYFSESEANAALNVKQGETIKLPDPDLLFQSVMRQVVFPTNDNNSAMYTQSLLENMYGRTGRSAYDGTGRLPRFYRDDRTANVPPVIDPLAVSRAWRGSSLVVPTNSSNDPDAPIGQDELYRL